MKPNNLMVDAQTGRSTLFRKLGVPKEENKEIIELTEPLPQPTTQIVEAKILIPDELYGITELIDTSQLEKPDLSVQEAAFLKAEQKKKNSENKAILLQLLVDKMNNRKEGLDGSSGQNPQNPLAAPGSMPQPIEVFQPLSQIFHSSTSSDPRNITFGTHDEGGYY